MNYSELNKLPAEAFLNPSNFKTEMDTWPNNVKNNYSGQQYAKGLEIGGKAQHVFITAGGTWGATMKHTGQQFAGSMSSYEGIGYHSCTADLLRGFLDSGAPIYVYREYGDSMIINEKRELVPMPENA